MLLPPLRIVAGRTFLPRYTEQLRGHLEEYFWRGTLVWLGRVSYIHRAARRTRMDYFEVKQAAFFTELANNSKGLHRVTLARWLIEGR